MSRKSKIVAPQRLADAEPATVTATLESLLANPVPGITVRRAVAADEARPQPTASPPPASAPATKTTTATASTSALREPTRPAASIPPSRPSGSRPAADPPAASVPPPAQAYASAPAPVSAPASAPASAPKLDQRPLDGLAHLSEAERQRLRALVEPGPIPVPQTPSEPVARPATPSLPPSADPRATEAAPPRNLLAVAAAAAGSGAARGTFAASEIGRALLASQRTFFAIGLFSVVINVLMLAGPLFMLQIYDRVMTSGSIPTLIALLALTAVVYAIIGFVELVRSRVLTRVGVEIDQRLGDRIFEAGLKRSIAARGASSSALRELDGIRQFLASPAPTTLFDAPWTLVYLLVIFLVHWTLGVVALLGAAALLVIALVGEAVSRPASMEASRAAQRSVEMAETGQRNADSLLAMGMLTAYRARWQSANALALVWQIRASDRLGSTSAVSRTLRLLLQSVMLAIGAALALEGQISAGAIVAATIIYGRALAPIEQLIAQWRAFLRAFESYGKLADLLAAVPPTVPRTALPRARGQLEVTGLKVAAPESGAVIIADIAFTARPGQMLAIIGPSGSGKSTLARALVGLWPAAAGTIALDGAPLAQWDSEALGRQIGYLPQDVELFAGTVRDNIARFRTDVDDSAVVAAAKAAHAHDMILGLPKGYDTELGAFGTYLSAGQRQRVALARALFDNPALVVLDEPNANLDRVGDEALSSAIDGMRARGQAVIVVSHRVQAIGRADTLLLLDRGRQAAFGSRDDVMTFIKGGQPPRAEPTRAEAAPVERSTGGRTPPAGEPGP